MATKNDFKALSDAQLFDQIQKGNELAFSNLYYRYSKMLYGLSLKYLKDEAMAQEIVQQTFIKFWESRKKITITSSLRNYLYTMARNNILNKFRTEKHILVQNYEEAQHVFMEDEMDLIVQKEQKIEALKEAIEKLPQRKKEVCLLKLNEQMTNEQIAEHLGVSVSTVKSHYAQAKEMLKKHLKNDINFLFFIILFSS